MLNILNTKNIKRASIIFLSVVLGAALIGTAFGYGYRRGVAVPKTVELQLKNASSSDVADFNLFWQTWQIIKDDALRGAEVKDKDLVYGAIRGLVNSLGDPHSVFLPPSEAKKFSDDLSGSFDGVGMEIGQKNGNLVVIAPLKDTPADKAGLMPNDRILKIDDTDTDSLDIEQSVKLIRGPSGTDVTLLIFRNNWSTPKEFKIKRATIDITTVEFEMKDGGIARIKLNSFNERASIEFFEALKKAQAASTRGLILDLRNNPGGFLEVAVDLAGWFMDKGTLVVSEQYRTGKRDEFKSSGTGDLKNIPTVVLVNGGSASASEILAGALRDNQKIKLIGEKTFGKGTVQILEDLTDGSTIKITVANWVLPDGTIIEKDGLKPDIEVKLTEEDVNNKKDPQLDRALEELRKKLGQN